MQKGAGGGKNTNGTKKLNGKVNGVANANGVGPRIATNGYRLPDQLPRGTVLTDSVKTRWLLGSVIGVGGFGEIYCARRLDDVGLGDDDQHWPFVCKVDHMNGPLYAEMHFYHRVAKEEAIVEWMVNEDLKFLGMPRYIASGIYDHLPNAHGHGNGSGGGSAPKGRGRPPQKVKKVSTTNGNSSHAEHSVKYRFLVMQRFGDDLQKMLARHGKFSCKTACTTAMKIIDILQYIHSFGYIHADIKASNLLLGLAPPRSRNAGGAHDEIWLVDYGLVERYMTREGEHKEHEEDQRRANNGTVEFTSRDAHIGALSRRSDLEIVAYNVLSWLSGGRLPWMNNLRDHVYVRDTKTHYMQHIDQLISFCFNNSQPPRGLREFVTFISKLDFKAEPDYAHVKQLLKRVIELNGEKYDATFTFVLPKRKSISNGSRSRVRNGNSESISPPKRARKQTQQQQQQQHEHERRGAGSHRRSISVPVSTPPSTPRRSSTYSSSSTSPGGAATMDNPTPAMLEIMRQLKLKEKKKLAKQKQQKLAIKMQKAAKLASGVAVKNGIAPKSSKSSSRALRKNT